MGKSKDLATGETRFVNTAGDTMTGNLAINNASGSQVTLHRTDTTIANDDLYGQIILSGDDADTNSSGTRGYIRGRSQGSGGGLKMEFGTAAGGLAIGDPRMTINADGIVTKPNQPSFMVIMTSAPTLTGTAVTTLPWNSEIFDVGNNFNTSTYTFTAPVGGKYFMHLHFEFHSDSSWTNSTWSYVGDWYVNGVQKTGADFWGHSSRYNICPNTAILNLGSNDNVNVRARPNNNTLRYSGDSANAFSNCKWMGYLIG